MKKFLARFVRQSPAMVVAMIALFVALTGTAVATTSALITGKQIKNNSITGLDIKNKSVTAADIKGQLRGARGAAGTPGPAGPAGPGGAQGPQGIQGPQGPGARWALVRADGVILDQSGGITMTQHSAGGSYWINMGANISRQMVLVTIRGFDGHAQVVQCAGPNGTGCILAANNTNHLFVYSHNAAGTPTDKDFWITTVGPNAAGSGLSATPIAGPNPALGE